MDERIYFDGECGLCHRWVLFTLRRERGRELFRYAPLQGTTFAAEVPPPERNGLPDSVVVRTADGRLLVRSAAALHVMNRVGGPWRALAAALRLVPRPLRDWGYDRVAAGYGRWWAPVIAPAAVPVSPSSSSNATATRSLSTACSVATALAAAAQSGQPLWHHLGTETPVLPLPMVNIVSGGAHAGRQLDLQDVLVVPVGAATFSQAIELVASYAKGRQSVDEYVEQTAIANPHAQIEYRGPGGEPRTFPRASEELPPETREIKPHPHGIELGVLMKMLKEAGTKGRRDAGTKEGTKARRHEGTEARAGGMSGTRWTGSGIRRCMRGRKRGGRWRRRRRGCTLRRSFCGGWMRRGWSGCS